MIPFQLVLLPGQLDDDNLVPEAVYVPGEFCEQAVVASLHKRIVDEFGIDAQFIFESETADQSSVLDIVEVEILTYETEPARKGSVRSLEVEIIAHVWARIDPTNVYRVQEIVDEVIRVLDNADFNVQDFDGTGEPVVGGLRMKESKVSDQGEAVTEDLQTTYYHHIVRVTGCAQETM